MPTRRNEFDGPGEGPIVAIRRALSQGNRIHGRGSLVTFMVVLSMIAVLVAVLWYSYPREAQTHDDLTVPVVRAGTEPYRNAPEDQGGMDVPHRDSTIFDTLREADNRTGERVENLLADDEDPMPRERLFAGLNTAAGESPQNLFESDSSDSNESQDLTEPVTSKESGPDAPEISDETRALVQSVLRKQEEDAASAREESAKKEMAKASEAAAKIEPAAGAAVPATGHFFVQLASLKSRDAAETAWKQAQKKYDSLSGSSYRVQSADLAERGTFYRVQAGPFLRDKADQVCASIKAKTPGGCLVVGR